MKGGVSTDLVFERPRSGARSVLLHLGIGAGADPDETRELEELATSAGAEVLGTVTGSRRAPDSRYFVGSGKVDEVAGLLERLQGDLVIVYHSLTPSQERNLERRLQCRVLDRTGLILDIFAQRARSFEGKLQVELAQLRHLSTRLVRGWTHLERQKGGIGLRGPGETQLETDRRLIGQRIRHLRKRLARVAAQREQGRRTRRKADVPTVSLVGYTNAGKSTLFNALTGAAVYSADKLFATLDPTLRRIELPGADAAVLADTVGFVRDLPHELIAAFRATLAETRNAALLLHVIDASDPQRHERIAQVNDVLAAIDAERVPQIAVFNKIDLIAEEPRVERNAAGVIERVWISAASGAGLDLLSSAIADRLAGDRVRGVLRLRPEQGRVRARLFDLGAVRQERVPSQGGWELELEMPVVTFEQFCSREGLDKARLEARSLPH